MKLRTFLKGMLVSPVAVPMAALAKPVPFKVTREILTIDQVLARNASVISDTIHTRTIAGSPWVGLIPETPFPHLGDTIRILEYQRHG